MTRERVVARDLIVRYSVAAGPDSGSWMESITVAGDGSFDVRRGARGTKPMTTTGQLSTRDLLSIIELLVKIEAWKEIPLDPARPPPPGSFPDRLYVSTGGAEMNVLDWSRSDNRVQRVRNLIVTIADSKATPAT
ncbi:MAG: hypothetical protein ACRELY_12930 [Polyangiaceae bacterium]